MTTCQRAFALYLAGYSYLEIEYELRLAPARAQLCCMMVQIEWRDTYG